MRRKILQRLALIAVACATIAGLASILTRHATQADSYPAFSSFRTLPEGASILYDALSHTPGVTAQRNTQPLGAVRFDNAALLMLGVPIASIAGNGQWFNDMEELASKGNRVIIGLTPHRNRFLQSDAKQLAATLKQWNIELAFFQDIDVRDEEEEKLMAGWPMYFSSAKGWDATRKENNRAVVIERAQGKGRLVLLANSYLFSNAAMVDDRQTSFLAGLIGPMHVAVFDETHFGIEETGSIAGLARRYRLQGLILGLIITASLFVWKNAAGFPPALDRLQPVQSVQGEDAKAAFLNLLRRNIPQDEILATCVEAWRKLNQRKAAPNLTAIVDLSESGRKTPAQTYAQIQHLLDGAKHRPS